MSVVRFARVGNLEREVTMPGSRSDRLSTYSERVGSSAALLVVIGFGLVAIGEPIWRIMKTLLPD